MARRAIQTKMAAQRVVYFPPVTCFLFLFFLLRVRPRSAAGPTRLVRIRRGVVAKVRHAFDFGQHGPARLSLAADPWPAEKEGRNQLSTSAYSAAATRLCLCKYLSIRPHFDSCRRRRTDWEDEKVGHDSPVSTIRLNPLPAGHTVVVLFSFFLFLTIKYYYYSCALDYGQLGHQSHSTVDSMIHIRTKFKSLLLWR